MGILFFLVNFSGIWKRYFVRGFDPFISLTFLNPPKVTKSVFGYCLPNENGERALEVVLFWLLHCYYAVDHCEILKTTWRKWQWTIQELDCSSPEHQSQSEKFHLIPPPTAQKAEPIPVLSSQTLDEVMSHQRKKWDTEIGNHLHGWSKHSHKHPNAKINCSFSTPKDIEGMWVYIRRGKHSATLV